MSNASPFPTSGGPMFSLHTQLFVSIFFLQVTPIFTSIRIEQTTQADDKIEVRTSMENHSTCLAILIQVLFFSWLVTEVLNFASSTSLCSRYSRRSSTISLSRKDGDFSSATIDVIVCTCACRRIRGQSPRDLFITTNGWVAPCRDAGRTCFVQLTHSPKTGGTPADATIWVGWIDR